MIATHKLEARNFFNGTGKVISFPLSLPIDLLNLPINLVLLGKKNRDYLDLHQGDGKTALHRLEARRLTTTS